jgi:CubicO group peptidase (beta-lactamase class C family)
VTILAVLVVAPLVAGAPVARAATSEDLATRIEHAVQERMAASGVPSAAFVVVARSEPSVARGLGRATANRPVTGSTPFVLGSTSKSFTALAVMQLVDAGLVDLDAPVRHYVPELQLADGEPVDAITVRHLLQQTSGIPSAAGGPVLASAKDGTALDAVGELRGSRLAAAPGTLWQYSNVNYVLAGLVVERTSGMTYPQYVQRRIYTPLGMTRSFTSIGPARDAGLADGHRYWFGRAVRSDPVVRPGLMAAGYLISTADDLGRYLRMYLDGGVADDGTRIVSAHGLRTMLEPGPAAQLGEWAGGMTSRYAMGWFVGGPWRQPTTFHPGNSPDTTAMITVIPERGLAVATLVGASHELPLPGNPAAPDRITRAAVEAALGEPTTSGGSLRSFYAVFDLIVLALLGAAGYWLARGAGLLRRPRRTRHRVRTLVSALIGIIVGAAVLGVPTLLGFGWRGAWTWLPDASVVLLGLGMMLVAGGAARLCALLRRQTPDRRAADGWPAAKRPPPAAYGPPTP